MTIADTQQIDMTARFRGNTHRDVFELLPDASHHSTDRPCWCELELRSPYSDAMIWTPDYPIVRFGR